MTPVWQVAPVFHQGRGCLDAPGEGKASRVRRPLIVKRGNTEERIRDAVFSFGDNALSLTSPVWYNPSTTMDPQPREHHGVSSAVRTRLREAVFGTQDGLISTLGALTGIAEGTQSGQAVIIAGVVIIVVESLSMAAGSYLSSKSQREYLERLLREEEEEIKTEPEKERQEIWDMYRERGYTDAEIEIIARRLMANPHLLLEDMAHKELGICPAALEEPLGNAVVMGMAYVIGGLVPIVPYLLLPVGPAMPVSIEMTLLVLFLFGGLKGRIVKQVWWRSGAEMLVIAGMAALAGFAIGRFAKILIPQ